MPIEPGVLDLRVYRPAAVIVTDLVGHSRLEKTQIHKTQQMLEAAFYRAQTDLQIRGVHHKYTGDGYLCAFVGDSCARLMDFVNAAFPDLLATLSAQGQGLRAGVDFGLLHLRDNLLTKIPEHFDRPGINAARLESVAGANQILCTSTVFKVFSPHYPGMFVRPGVRLTTKDRRILAFQIRPSGNITVQQTLFNLIYRKGLTEDHPQGQRVLIVDDDTGVRELLKHVVEIGKYTVDVASDGREALELFEPGKYAVVLTDLMMPNVDGLELCRLLLTRQPDIPVIIISGYASVENEVACMRDGAVGFIAKPCNIHEIYGAIAWAPSKKRMTESLAILSDKPGRLLFCLDRIAEQAENIQAICGGNDVVSMLLRHHVKGAVSDFVRSVHPGTEAVDRATALIEQLRSVHRLAKVTSVLKGLELKQFIRTYLEDLHKRHPNVQFNVTIPEGDFPETFSLNAGKLVVLVVAELVDNAIAAMKERGHLRIELSRMTSMDTLGIAAEDDGPGIEPELQQKLFCEGTSTKGVGRGFGLYLISEALRALGGSIVHEPRDGGGSRFFAAVPMTQSGREDAEAGVTAKDPSSEVIPGSQGRTARPSAS